MASSAFLFRVLPRLICVGVIAVVVTGCSLQFSDRSAGDFESSTPGVLTVATEEVPSPGFWQGTVENPDGGFEYGLAEALAERFDLDRVEIRTVPFSDMIAGDLAGADLGIRQLTPTPGRDEVLDFSVPYLSATPAALVRKGTTVPDLKSARELIWGVAEGTTLVAILEDRIRADEITVAPDREATLQLLDHGKVDAVLLDLPVALAFAGASEGALEVAAQFEADETLAVALPQGSANREAVNSALRALQADGTISDLAKEWLGVSLGESSFTVPGVPLIR